VYLQDVLYHFALLGLCIWAVLAVAFDWDGHLHGAITDIEYFHMRSFLKKSLK
jgi:hypothetical protein